MKKIIGIALAGVILCAAAGYYFIIYKPKIDKSKELLLSKSVIDVIEMKSGNNIRGRILKEGPDSILIRNAEGTVEILVLRTKIANVRKATAEDVKAARAEMDNAEKIAKEASRYDREREVRLKAYYEERNKREVSRAQRYKGQGQSGTDGAINDAKSKGQVIAGMSYSDVIEVMGQPDSKKAEFQGNAARERWFYNDCGRIKQSIIDFYNGKVESASEAGAWM